MKSPIPRPADKVAEYYAKNHSISTCHVCGCEIYSPFNRYTIVFRDKNESPDYIKPIVYFCSESCEDLFRIGRGV